MLLGMKPLTHHNLTISAWSLSLTLAVDSRRSALDEPVPEGMPHALPLVARELALGIHIHAPHEHAADALHVVVADALELSNGVGTVGLGVSKCLGDAFDERATFEMGDPPPGHQGLRPLWRKGSFAQRRRHAIRQALWRRHATRRGGEFVAARPETFGLRLELGNASSKATRMIISQQDEPWGPYASDVGGNSCGEFGGFAPTSVAKGS
jgi:hypothetical protein